MRAMHAGQGRVERKKWGRSDSRLVGNWQELPLLVMITTEVWHHNVSATSVLANCRFDLVIFQLGLYLLDGKISGMQADFSDETT